MIPRPGLFRMRSCSLVEPFIPVGDKGVEPLSLPCRGSVLPLN